MEKPPLPPTESVHDSFEDYHTRVKELLGAKYDEQRVNGCMCFQAPGGTESIYDELKKSLEGETDESYRDKIRERWLEKYDVMKGITH